MVQIFVPPDATAIYLTGHGIQVAQPVAIASGVTVMPDIPQLDADDLQHTVHSLTERAAILSMHDIATFAIRVEADGGSKSLATKSWNNLWAFHLLSLAVGSPCFILYMRTASPPFFYSVTNRNLIIRPLAESVNATVEQLEWAAQNRKCFNELVPDQRFGRAMRYYGNSHYLFDLDARAMLLWAGIEGLFELDGEMTRRVALYSTILLDQDPETKASHFADVKKAYGVRSRIVHGMKPPDSKLTEHYLFASKLLARLLAKCVELGRVPTASELDHVAMLTYLPY